MGTQIFVMLCFLFGMYGSVHIFGVPNYVFWISIVLGGMFFCGWWCPFGALQEWVRFVGKKLTGVTWNLPESVHNYLSPLRYLMRGIVLLGIMAPAWLNARRTMLSSHYGWEVDVTAYVVMGGLLGLALFMDRPYCKYLCGFGGEFSLLGLFRIFTFKRDKIACVGCKKCNAACPMGITVATTNNLRDPRCINCFKCVTSCPVSKALTPGLALPRLGDFVNRDKPSVTPMGENPTKPKASDNVV